MTVECSGHVRGDEVTIKTNFKISHFGCQIPVAIFKEHLISSYELFSEDGHWNLMVKILDFKVRF